MLQEEEDLLQAMAGQFDMPAIDLAKFEIPPGLFALVPANIARQYHAVPFHLEGNDLTIAVSEPSKCDALRKENIGAGKTIQFALALRDEISKVIEQQYGF